LFFLPLSNLIRCQSTQRAVRSEIVVFLPPVFDLFSSPIFN
jgi:hypothetical protein